MSKLDIKPNHLHPLIPKVGSHRLRTLDPERTDLQQSELNELTPRFMFFYQWVFESSK